ncbi:uncharacterized protein LOC144449453 [Glandiceps talaboti]
MMVLHQLYVLAFQVILFVHLSQENPLLQSYYQIQIPRERLGYVYNKSSSASPVHIDMFVCLQCADDKSSLSPILDVADHYGPKLVRLVLHGYQVAYVKGSYLATLATRAVDQIDSSKTVLYIQSVLSNQEEIRESPMNTSDSDIVEILTDLAVNLNIDRQKFLEKFEDKNLDELCRYEMEMANSRGVYRSPTFLINDMQVFNFEPSWTFHNWTSILDSLLEDYETVEPGPKCCRENQDALLCLTDRSVRHQPHRHYLSSLHRWWRCYGLAARSSPYEAKNAWPRLAKAMSILIKFYA